MGSGAVPSRLVSLDVLRGLTVAGMVLVNTPGTRGQIRLRAAFAGLALVRRVLLEPPGAAP